MTFSIIRRMIRDLDVYESFLAVAAEGSITAAAQMLGRSIQAVSRDLARLEADLGVSLIARTTRTHRITDAGRIFVDRVKPLLSELEAAWEEARDHATVIAGTLRVAAPTLFGPQVLAPIIADFMARHPQLAVRLELADALIDPVVSGADVTVRIGDSPDSSAIARRIGEVRQVMIAAPSYLARHGRPEHPDDLAAHACVIRYSAADARRWTVGNREREAVVEVRGVFETNSVAAANRAVELGLGVGRALLWQVREAVEQGRLEIILADFEPPPRPVLAIWSPGVQLPSRARHFVEFLAQKLAAEGL